MKAYYSVVQLIPNRLRDERINIAVILQCPHRGYSRMLVRKYMDSIIETVFPDIDGRLIRLLTQGIASNFKSQKISEGLFSEHDVCHPDYLKSFINGYDIINFSLTKTLILQDSDNLDLRIEMLFDKLIQMDKPKSAKQNITKEILTKTVVTYLLNKSLNIIVDAPKFHGLRWENHFDALHNKFDRRHVQFLSFDLIESPEHLVKYYYSSVQDMKESKEHAKDQFACVIQPPITNTSLTREYNNVIKEYTNVGIFVYPNESVELNRLATGLAHVNGLPAVA